MALRVSRYLNHLSMGHISMGLRIRLILTLCAFVVPVLGLTLWWSYTELRLVSQERSAHAAAIAQLLSNQTDDLFRAISLVDEKAETRSRTTEQSCTRLKQRIMDAVAAEADVGIYANGRPLCTSENGGRAIFKESMLRSLRARLIAGENPAIAGSNEAGTGFAYGYMSSGASGAATMTIIGLPPIDTVLPVDAIESNLAVGAALVDLKGGFITQWGNQALPGWLPTDTSPLVHVSGVTSLETAAGSGASYRYFSSPLKTIGAVLITAYPAGPFAPEHRQFYEVTASFVLVLTAVIIGVIWSLDHTLMRWIIYLRRIVLAHAKGRWSVRATRLADAPSEIRELGEAINFMAEHMSERASLLETALTEKASLLRELHHRIKNNFQVIVSLLSLHKKGLPPERWNETRFLEEHIRAMAIAYRASYAAGSAKGVGPIQLIRDISEALCETAGIRPGCIRIIAESDSQEIDLDKAIGLGLYFAYFLPPYLTRDINTKRPLTIELTMIEDSLNIVFSNLPTPDLTHSSLRQRLADAYARQLSAFVHIPADRAELTVNVPIRDEEGFEAA